MGPEYEPWMSYYTKPKDAKLSKISDRLKTMEGRLSWLTQLMEQYLLDLEGFGLIFSTSSVRRNTANTALMFSLVKRVRKTEYILKNLVLREIYFR